MTVPNLFINSILISLSKHGSSRVKSQVLALHLGKFFMLFLSSADFFQNQLFRKILSGILSKCQTDWTQIRPDVVWGLIWVQTVFRCNQ